jgi:hypothetical protein
MGNWWIRPVNANVVKFQSICDGTHIPSILWSHVGLGNHNCHVWTYRYDDNIVFTGLNGHLTEHHSNMYKAFGEPVDLLDCIHRTLVCKTTNKHHIFHRESDRVAVVDTSKIKNETGVGFFVRSGNLLLRSWSRNSHFEIEHSLSTRVIWPRKAVVLRCLHTTLSIHPKELLNIMYTYLYNDWIIGEPSIRSPIDDIWTLSINSV